MLTSSTHIQVVDLFAGPGGLGEGFSSCHVRGESPFRVTLSVEKDEVAHSTLKLRASYRRLAGADRRRFVKILASGGLEAVRSEFRSETEGAGREAMRAELGRDNAEIHSRVASVIEPAGRWVLIGGPPCQAYSLVGRSRNSAIDGYRLDRDSRHGLYREYLNVIAKFWPAVFVMENVKGLLSARIHGQELFRRILADLSDPGAATGGKPRFGYTIYPAFADPVCTALTHVWQPADYVVRAEVHGVPQARHRVILVGVRDDVRKGFLDVAPSNIRGPRSVAEALAGLPELRSGLSEGLDTEDAWLAVLRAAANSRWLKELRQTDPILHDSIRLDVSDAKVPAADRGGECLHDCHAMPADRDNWFRRYMQDIVFNHSTRTHIESDLHRYLFVSSYGRLHGRSPKLNEFPPSLQPAHRNITRALNGGLFSDRFRVQLADRPASTITSHISKDGHYYIHPDPRQCRSLTVREAARLQTFPDSYFFCGSRTAQYLQVGNAVPPLLARQIAQAVHRLLL